MKILNICNVDYAGVGVALTSAVNAHMNHHARHVCMKAHHFNYPIDLRVESPREMAHWIDWADVVNVHVYPRPLAHANRRPSALIMTQHGSYFRTKTEKVKQSHMEWDVKKVLGTTADLVKYGATWLPTAIPAAEYLAIRRDTPLFGKPIVCQAPSNPKKKNTAEIEDILGGRADLDLLILHHMDHAESIRKRARADVFIDRFRLGLGVAGLEAAAMGIPVIACSSAEDEGLIRAEVGYLPYYKADLRGLEEAVDILLSESTVYWEYSDRGLQYIADFHDYPVVAKRYAAICEEVHNL